MGETYFDKIYICWNALLVNRDSQQMRSAGLLRLMAILDFEATFYLAIIINMAAVFVLFAILDMVAILNLVAMIDL